ncbi:MAG: acyl-CoA dehydrogenase family protein, partial [Bradymonadaceae bacterium]
MTENTDANRPGPFDYLTEATDADVVRVPGGLTEQQQMIVESARNFMNEGVIPRRGELEEGDPEVMREVMREAADVGLTAVGIPERFGGVELDLPTGMLVGSELARDLSFSLSLGAHIGIGTFPLVIFGDEELKERYLPQLVTAERIGAYALTEPGGGSDALNPRTRAADRDGGGYRLNGRKQWITNAQIAGLYTVFANLDGEEFTAFLLPAEADGIEVGAPEDKMGRHGSPTGALMFDDAPVPAGHVVGGVGQGHRVALNTLNIARIKLGYGASGGIGELLEISSNYASERTQFGRPIGAFELIRSKITKMATQKFLLDGICHHVVHCVDEELPDDLDGADTGPICDVLKKHAVTSALIKVYGSEALADVADEAVQIHGGYGYMEEYDVCRIYRDVRADRIFEGTNEVNRLLAARNIFKAGMAGEIALPELMQLGQAAPPAASGTARELADALRWVFARCIGAAADKLEGDFEENQDVAAGLVDLATELFVLDTAAARVEARDRNSLEPDRARALLECATEYVRGRT